MALFIGSNMMGQDAPGFMNANDASNDGTVPDTVTAGVAVPYFVMPDAVLNSGFSAAYDTLADRSSQGLSSTWTWFGGVAGRATVSFQSQDNGPYAEVTWSGTGLDTLFVYETSEATCVGDTSPIRTIVVAAPAFDATTDGPGLGDTTQICVTTGVDISVASITDNGIGGGNLQFSVDSLVQTVDADLAVLSTVSATTTFYPTVAENAALGNANVVVFTKDLTVRGGAITMYSFTFTGLSDHISRKSDYLGLTDKTGATDSEYTYYAPTQSTSRVWIVYPAPNTGDIYYIPRTFNL